MNNLKLQPHQELITKHVVNFFQNIPYEMYHIHLTVGINELFKDTPARDHSNIVPKVVVDPQALYLISEEKMDSIGDIARRIGSRVITIGPMSPAGDFTLSKIQSGTWQTETWSRAMSPSITEEGFALTIASSIFSFIMGQ